MTTEFEIRSANGKARHSVRATLLQVNGAHGVTRSACFNFIVPA
jgi:hypothetical protein